MTVCLCATGQRQYSHCLSSVFKRALRVMHALVDHARSKSRQPCLCLGHQALDESSLTHLEYLELLQPVLHKLLYPLLPSLALVFPESIARSPFCVFAEIVGGELSALSEQRSVLQWPVSDLRIQSLYSQRVHALVSCRRVRMGSFRVGDACG